MAPARRWVGKCACRLPCSFENPGLPLPPGHVRCVAFRRSRTESHSCTGTIRSSSSWLMTHSDSGLSKRRRRPVFGSRRLLVRFQIHRPAYFSLSRMRLMVAGDQPLTLRMLPGTFSSLSVLTICGSGMPSAFDVKIRRITAASLGSTSHLVAVWPRPTLLVHLHLAGGHRLVAERLLSDEETAFLLPDMSTQRLLQVAQLELIEDAAHPGSRADRAFGESERDPSRAPRSTAARRGGAQALLASTDGDAGRSRCALGGGAVAWTWTRQMRSRDGCGAYE